MSVEMFDPSQYVTYHDWTFGVDGNATPVLHARFRSDDCEFDGYAKPFSIYEPHEASTMLNEVTGWLLARSCNLPCSERAFFIEIPAAELPTYNGRAQLPALTDRGTYLCFVTQAISNVSVRGIVSTEKLVQEQSAWPHCNSAIAFDEGIANPDRHVYNLLRTGDSQFSLIDHGYLLRDDPNKYPDYWEDGALPLRVSRAFENLLHRHTYIVLNRNSQAVCAQACKDGVALGEQLRKSVQKHSFEISFWCSVLTPGKSGNWLNFLYSRVKKTQMYDLLNRRFGLLPTYVDPSS